MYRVVTKFHNGSPRPIVERGPWHPTRHIAEDWALALRQHGYVAFVEAQNGMIDAGGGAADDNSDLLDALASMA